MIVRGKTGKKALVSGKWRDVVPDPVVGFE